MQIRIGIVGYGNLGRGVECALKQNADMELVGVFTRRIPDTLKILTPNVGVFSVDNIQKYQENIDVMILCGGSATDLPAQSPYCAKWFHVVDSFDTHAKIPEHFALVDEVAKSGKKVAVISAGWDPGLFSLNRLYGECILPEGRDYTFWGKGVSQGHSDAIRRIEGVLNAKQYTVPVATAVEAVRIGQNPELTTRQKHTRVCFVVAKEGADRKRIEQEIVYMPNYFADYDTTVNFIEMDEFEAHHGGMPHGGFVIRAGQTGNTESGANEERHKQIIEYALKLDSNPEFTASVLVACARAAHRLAEEGVSGAKTMFDIPPAYLSPKNGEELRRTML